jgi:DNA-binding transcriptional LysR family regulator
MTKLGSIDLKAFNIFSLVAASGSIRQAALRASVTAPAISRRIRAFEDGLGVSLFERRSSGMRLTHAGRELLEAAKQVLRDVDRAAGRARETGTATVGRVLIGTYFSASAGRLRDALRCFIQRHRRVELAMMEGVRDELLDAVRLGEVDVAILLGPDDEVGLDRMRLWAERMMVALPTAHGLAGQSFVSWRALAAETFIVTRRGSGPEVREKVQTLLPGRSKARFSEQDIGREAMFNLVGAGLGVAVLAESASGVSYPGVVFRSVGDETGPTTVEAAVYWDAKRDNPALRRFLVLLRMRQEPASREGGAG